MEVPYSTIIHTQKSRPSLTKKNNSINSNLNLFQEQYLQMLENLKGRHKPSKTYPLNLANILN